MHLRMKNLLILLITLCALGADGQCILDTLVTETPEGCPDGENIFQVSGSLDMSCPADTNECNTALSSTVWYQINIDNNNANSFLSNIQTDGFDAVWYVYYGTSFENKMHINESAQPGDPPVPCSFSEGEEYDFHNVPVINDTLMNPFKYWVAITAEGPVTDPFFEFAYASSLSCVACSGDNSTDCDNGEFTYRDEDNIQSTGPFCPGSEVTVCIDFTYDASSTGNDWLHGMIPTFGSGWDIEASDLSNVNIGPGWEWFEAEGDCAPKLNGYSLPYACTYMKDGRLQICNVACDPTCPCENGPALPDGSPLPSGWFYNSPSTEYNCGNDCSPASFYGVVNGLTVSVGVCIPLKVKTFATTAECEANNDLSITIQTTSDAVTGCKFDIAPCILDPSFRGPPIFVSCDQPPLATIVDSTLTICEGENYEGITESGSYTLELTSSEGCDSIVSLALEVIPTVIFDESLTICQGATVSYNGVQYSETGNYTDTLITIGNCIDTIYNINLLVLEAPTGSLEAEICSGESFLGYTSTGTYTQFEIAENGCDSIVIIDLIVQDTEMSSQDISLCEGDEIIINGTVYGQAGIFSDTTYSDIDCPILINTLNIDLVSLLTITLDIDICQGEVFMGFDLTGTYSIELPAEEGCDTLITLILDVLPLDHPDCIVATENELDQKSYHLYPVPAQDVLYIDGVQEQIIVQVYDLEGRLLKSTYDTKSNSVDIKELVPGLYILAIRAADGSLSNKKFIKL